MLQAQSSASGEKFLSGVSLGLSESNQNTADCEERFVNKLLDFSGNERALSGTKKDVNGKQNDLNGNQNDLNTQPEDLNKVKEDLKRHPDLSQENSYRNQEDLNGNPQSVIRNTQVFSENSCVFNGCLNENSQTANRCLQSANLSIQIESQQVFNKNQQFSKERQHTIEENQQTFIESQDTIKENQPTSIESHQNSKENLEAVIENQHAIKENQQTIKDYQQTSIEHQQTFKENQQIVNGKLLGVNENLPALNKNTSFESDGDCIDLNKNANDQDTEEDEDDLINFSQNENLFEFNSYEIPNQYSDLIFPIKLSPIPEGFAEENNSEPTNSLDCGIKYGIDEVTKQLESVNLLNLKEGLETNKKLDFNQTKNSQNLEHYSQLLKNSINNCCQILNSSLSSTTSSLTSSKDSLSSERSLVLPASISGSTDFIIPYSEASAQIIEKASEQLKSLTESLEFSQEIPLDFTANQNLSKAKCISLDDLTELTSPCLVGIASESLENLLKSVQEESISLGYKLNEEEIIAENDRSLPQIIINDASKIEESKIRSTKVYELEPIGNELDFVVNQFDPINNQLDPIKNHLDPINNQLDSIKNQLDPTKNQLDSIGNQFDPILNQFDPIGSQFDPAQLELIKTQLYSKETQIDPIKTKFGLIKTEFVPVNTQINQIKTQFDPTRIDSIENYFVRDGSKSLEELVNNTKDLTKKIVELNKALVQNKEEESLNHKIDQNELNITDLGALLNITKGLLQKLNERNKVFRENCENSLQDEGLITSRKLNCPPDKNSIAVENDGVSDHNTVKLLEEINSKYSIEGIGERKGEINKSEEFLENRKELNTKKENFKQNFSENNQKDCENKQRVCENSKYSENKRKETKNVLIDSEKKQIHSQNNQIDSENNQIDSENNKKNSVNKQTDSKNKQKDPENKQKDFDHQSLYVKQNHLKENTLKLKQIGDPPPLPQNISPKSSDVINNNSSPINPSSDSGIIACQVLQCSLAASIQENDPNKKVESSKDNVLKTPLAWEFKNGRLVFKTTPEPLSADPEDALEDKDSATYSEKSEISGLLLSKDVNRKFADSRSRLKLIEQKLREAGLKGTSGKCGEDKEGQEFCEQVVDKSGEVAGQSVELHCGKVSGLSEVLNSGCEIELSCDRVEQGSNKEKQINLIGKGANLTACETREESDPQDSTDKIESNGNIEKIGKTGTLKSDLIGDCDELIPELDEVDFKGKCFN